MSPYLVHIYIAAPGTLLKIEPFGTSTPGHMFYVIEYGAEKKSFGLAPENHGEMNGPGKVYDNDEKNYENPLYRRTLEITQAQYQKLKEFGDNPGRFGFSTYYQDARNNCVDFTWAALNHAGLHATTSTRGGKIPRKNYEGSLKPTRNIDDVQTIQPPFPKSAYNREKHNPMPKRSVLQKLLSENSQPAGARRA